MSGLGSTLVTLADVAKSKDKSINGVAEVLVKENAVLNDIPYMEMNQKTYHEESIRSALPAVYYRKANQAIPASKSTIEERKFTAAHFESKSQMDQAVAERGGKDRLAFNRWNQAQGHIQAQAQEHADLMLYGSPSDGLHKAPGFMDVYSSLSASEATSNQILDGGGTTDLTSIMLVMWGEQSIFGVYPAGTQAGLKRTDRSKGGMLVQIAALDSNGNAGSFWGYEEQFEIDHGLVVKDYRQAGRIANIDIAALKSGTGAADLIDLMESLTFKIHSLSNGNGVWYMNRTLEAFLTKQARQAVGSGGGLTFENFEGKRILNFLGMPIRRVDNLLNSEDRVV